MTNTLKKFRSYFTMAVAVVSVGFLTSCGDDSDDPEPDKNPTLNFIAGQQFTTADASVAGGSNFTTQVTGKSNTVTGRNLQNFKITVSYDGGTAVTVLDSAITKEEFNYTFTGKTRSIAGNEKWTFTVSDRDNLMASKSFTLTTTDPNASAAIKTYSATLLGAQSTNTAGSFFSSVDGTVNTVSQAKANQGKIDFIYFYGATNGATLAAPNDADVNTLSNFQLNTWTTKNATKFKRTALDATAFNAITTEAQLTTAVTAGTATSPDSRANQLSATTNNVLAFTTQSGKMGLILVKSITGTSAGTITIDVKVQK